MLAYLIMGKKEKKRTRRKMEKINKYFVTYNKNTDETNIKKTYNQMIK